MDLGTIEIVSIFHGDHMATFLRLIGAKTWVLQQFFSIQFKTGLLLVVRINVYI